MSDFDEIFARRYTRRNLLKAGAAFAGASAASPLLGKLEARSKGDSLKEKFPFAFRPIAGCDGESPKVPKGYVIRTLLRWGDPIAKDSPAFDPERQSSEAQATQFGYNCDFVGYIPLETSDVGLDTRGLLVVNHEYVNRYLMSPGYQRGMATQNEVDIELAAHGMSVVEIALDDNGDWQAVLNSPKNRRITMNTPFLATGPAAGHERMMTSSDRTGMMIHGTLNNCSGGVTPWGTVLSGEENTQNYFINRAKLPADDDYVKVAHARYQMPETDLGARRDKDVRWGYHYDRFDLEKEPHEPFRFSWVVEVDPGDPNWIPKKRTALGRFRHEAATVVHAKSGRVVVYSGDDAYFEYIYKYVSDATYDPSDPKAARDGDLLDKGTLYVAKLRENGTGRWIPLKYGKRGLEGTVEVDGQKVTFNSQADVLIQTRLAADFVGATKMDRPEDVQASPVTGKVYVALTKNPQRGTEGHAPKDGPNPRDKNEAGHVIEITEDGGEHSSRTFTWEVLMLCGDPRDETTYFGGYPKVKLNEQFSGIAAPDNFAFDSRGNLWIATDGSMGAIGKNDGLHALPLEGEARGHIGQFFSAVPGGEVCGPEFTPDGRTLFLSIQHPGDGSESTYHDPVSRWPDNDPDMPPRPTVIAIRRKDGKAIS